MRKNIFIIILCIITVTTVVYSYSTEYIQAFKVKHNIYIDGQYVSETALPRVLIEDKVYVPIRDLFSLLGDSVDWNQGKKLATINSRYKFSNANGTVSQQVACKLADVLFMEFFGDKFENTIQVVTEDEATYQITRYIESDTAENDATIIVNKRDGSVISFVSE